MRPLALAVCASLVLLSLAALPPARADCVYLRLDGYCADPKIWVVPVYVPKITTPGVAAEPIPVVTIPGTAETPITVPGASTPPVGPVCDPLNLVCVGGQEPLVPAQNVDETHVATVPASSPPASAAAAPPAWTR